MRRCCSSAAQHRLERLGDREGAVQDFKRILKIDPEHREALWRSGAPGDRGRATPTPPRHWLVRFLAVASRAPDDARRRRAPRPGDVLRGAEGAARARSRRCAGRRRCAPAIRSRSSGWPSCTSRLGEWRSAVEALRASEARLPDAPARAALHLRIGVILRDLGRDPPGAALAFRRAAELDPLGEGTRALVALHDALERHARGAPDHRARDRRAAARAGRADPLDDRLARRAWRSFLDELARRAPDAQRVRAARAAVAEVRDAATRRATGAPGVGRRAAPARRAGAEAGGRRVLGATSRTRARSGSGPRSGRTSSSRRWRCSRAAASAPPRARRAHRGRDRAAPRLDRDHAPPRCGLAACASILSGPGASAGPVAPLAREPEPALVLGMAALDGCPRRASGSGGRWRCCATAPSARVDDRQGPRRRPGGAASRRARRLRRRRRSGRRRSEVGTRIRTDIRTDLGAGAVGGGARDHGAREPSGPEGAGAAGVALRVRGAGHRALAARRAAHGRPARAAAGGRRRGRGAARRLARAGARRRARRCGERPARASCWRSRSARRTRRCAARRGWRLMADPRNPKPRASRRAARPVRRCRPRMRARTKPPRSGRRRSHCRAERRGGCAVPLEESGFSDTPITVAGRRPRAARPKRRRRAVTLEVGDALLESGVPTLMESRAGHARRRSSARRSPARRRCVSRSRRPIGGGLAVRAAARDGRRRSGRRACARW